MKTNQFLTNTASETMELGERLAKLLKSGDILCLFGDLGSGKTTLTKGLAKGLKIKKAQVNSPTFVLMNAYEGRLPLYHFDLYRLDDPKQIVGIGYDEFLYGEGVAIIEWAEKLGELLPKEYLAINLKHQTDQQRLIELKPIGNRYEHLVNQCLNQRS